MGRRARPILTLAMKVKLKEQVSIPFLTAGRHYTVVEVYDGDVRVVDDGGAPALFGASMFEIVEDSRPPLWRTSRDSDGVEAAAPDAFKQPGFFERLWNQSAKETQLFLALSGIDAEERRRFAVWVKRRL